MTLMKLPSAFEVLFVGIFATAMLDLWALMLNRAFQVPITNWSHVGRWVVGIPAGTFRHANIAVAPHVAYERAMGWSTHYVIGVIYGTAFLATLTAMSRTPTIYSASLFGLATVLAPWLILQPGLGMGYFASNAPRPNLTRALNVLSHLVFGIGLYLGSILAALAD